MAKPDTKNAHVRGKRTDPGEIATQTERLLEDPAFVRAFDMVHGGLVDTLANLQHDGSTETDDYEREVCRSLRTLKRVKRCMTKAIQGQKLREADFKPRKPEVNDKEDHF